jgi:hypothetical protein
MLSSLLVFIWSVVLSGCSSVDQQHLFPSYPPPDTKDFHPTPPHVRQPISSLYHTRYSEQTFIGTHDAAAIRTTKTAGHCQEISITTSQRSLRPASVCSKRKVIEIPTEATKPDYVTSTAH